MRNQLTRFQVQSDLTSQGSPYPGAMSKANVQGSCMTIERLDDARRRIETLDAQLVALAAQRVQAAREAGQAKRALGLPTVDFARERHVLETLRAAAERHGLSGHVAEAMLQPLMAAGASRQEADRIVATGTGKGRSAVVVGGAGRMGRWFVRFLQDAGFQVAVLDPAADAATNAAAKAALAQSDLVLVATPPSTVATLYDQWRTAPPAGVVADVASIKQPLLAALQRLQQAGVDATSFHPLFGPSLGSLRDADVLLCRTGSQRAQQAIRDLFAPTCARLVDVDLDEHDRLMADVLALAHATAIAYAASRPHAVPVHSTTQRRLDAVADAVASESPQVYFEIQAANPHAPVAVQRLANQLARLSNAVQAQSLDAFVALMHDGARSGAKA